MRTEVRMPGTPAPVTNIDRKNNATITGAKRMQNVAKPLVKPPPWPDPAAAS